MAADSRKFSELLGIHYNSALRYTHAICAGEKDDANDLLQDSLLKALENIGSLRDESKFRSWFFKIITREFYTSRRRYFWKRFLPLESAANIEKLPDVFAKFEQNENAALLQAALAKLSKKERTAILLFEVAEFSLEEIRLIENEKSLSAVKSRLSRSREKLRKIITEIETGKKKNFSLRRESTNGDLTNETIGLVHRAQKVRTEH